MRLIRSITNKIKRTSTKSKALLLVIFALAFGMANVAQAANEVQLEGWTKSLNVTANQTEYQDSTSAMVDDVVQVEVWHHNMENPAGAKANNTRVKVAVPNQPGKTQVITGTTSADNANTVTDSTVVNLSLDQAHVEYMPGTAKFKYNKGAQDGDAACQTGFNFPPDRCFVTVAVPDSVVTDPNGFNLDTVRGGPLTGCNAHHETVTVQVRVKASVVSVNKYVRHQGEGSDAWKTSTTAKPGENLEYMIRFKNEGNTELQHVVVGDNLPKYNAYVAGSTMLRNGANPNGIHITSDNITKGGIDVGNYMPGAVGYVLIGVKLDPIQAYPKCGTYDLRNVGIVRPQGMNDFYNTAQVMVNVECKEQPAQPAYKCEQLKVTNIGTSRNVTFNAVASASGGAKIKAYRYNFGDNTAELLSSESSVTHTYANDGQFVARVTVLVDVNGQTKTDTNEQCAVPLTFTAGKPVQPVQPGQPGQPASLVNTGPGEVAGLFAAVTIAAGVAHRWMLGRRLSNQ
jgi:uncharacterized repeat protein (TIGR01451 family)